MKARITCGRPMGRGDDADTFEAIRIDVTEDVSRINFVTISMTARQFFNAFVRNQGEVECEITVRSPHLLGATRERKSVLLNAERVGSFYDDKPGEREAATLCMSAEDVRAGWRYSGGFGNPHTWQDGGGYECSLFRFTRDGELVE